MLKSEFLRARLAPTHLAKIELMRQQTGLSTSQVIRQLIERAQVEPLKLSTCLVENANITALAASEDGTTTDVTV